MKYSNDDDAYVFSNSSVLRHKLCALALLVLSISLLSSCGEDELSSTSVVATRQSAVQATELDRWIRDSITLPYGIESGVIAKKIMVVQQPTIFILRARSR